ncbi:ImmA/IrrE family metallo-endopeptidase [Agrobacterium deltaense]|uniref:ImmA/IrrE family metallo-endopeptidase n=1 Tax=Agrobacterium deltaense TaxID=1183412 RepID=UPI001C6E2D7D|nr:ImmA/IrrE family metallo-endopeptidase [Agrobacterium deltaense]
MSTIEKGDRLEDAFYNFLLDQQNRGEDVYWTIPHGKCKILKKKKYPSRDRGAPVQFDIVVETYRPGAEVPSFYHVFECKNYSNSVPDHYVREFSDKLKELFPHKHKGVMVVSSKLQSGARKLAESRGIAIVKYAEHGVEIIADRRLRPFVSHSSLKSQIFRDEARATELKFSAYSDGNYFSTVEDFFASTNLGNELPRVPTAAAKHVVPYVSPAEMRRSTETVLSKIDYEAGCVDLAKVCKALGIDLTYSDSAITDADGLQILGTANFDSRTIEIYSHQDGNQKRFTLCHEIGHFFLRHDQYLRSDKILARDLEISDEGENTFNYERLEFQANAFAADLILPYEAFIRALAKYKVELEIKSKSHGYIFVDNQPENLFTYEKLLTLLSIEFEASKQVIEIKLKKMKLLNDQRVASRSAPVAQLVGNIFKS